MAGPIFHLLAARAWARERPELLDSPAFHLGAIAPDAIHMRPGTGKEEKQQTHLQNHSRLDMKPVAEYARAHRTQFDLGYIAHVLTDAFWCATYKELPGLFGLDGHTNPAVYYAEMEAAERALLEEPLLALLARAEAPEDHPLLRAGEISAWRDRVISYYRAMPFAPEGASITCAYARSFFERAGAFLSDMTRRLRV